MPRRCACLPIVTISSVGSTVGSRVGLMLGVAVALVAGCRSAPEPIADPPAQTIETIAASRKPESDDDSKRPKPSAEPPESAAVARRLRTWGKVGIPACDEYLRLYARCVDKMPDAVVEQVGKAIKVSADAWRKAAEGPGRDALADTCKAAKDAASRATEAMGCQW